MAKRVSEQDASPDKGGMRILYVELNGSNTSLQEGLRTLVAAMNKPVQVAPPATRRLVANQNATSATGQEPESDLFNQETAPDESVEIEQEQQAEMGQNGTARRKRGDGLNRDRNAGLSVVKSLNLHPEGKASLKDFTAKKQPKTQEEHIAVYIYYLKNMLDEANVGFSHIYSCFKETGQRMPGDLAQSCRNASKKGWIDTSDANDLNRTTRGDNLVEKDLPRAALGDDSGAK